MGVVEFFEYVDYYVGIVIDVVVDWVGVVWMGVVVVDVEVVVNVDVIYW